MVVPEELNFKKVGIKKTSSVNNYGFSTPSKGITLVMLFDEVEGPVLIDEVGVTIGKINMDSVTIRCRIFEVDPVTSLPGRDLLTENLIATSTEKQERLTFQLNQELWTNKPFFVGFEWITTKNQYEKLRKAKEAFPVDFIDEIVEANAGFKSYNVNENKRVQFRDSLGNVYKKVPLTKAQREILDQKDAASPKLQFKIKMKGTKTFSGSPITGRWFKISHEALISVKVGRSKEVVDLDKEELPAADQISFMGQSIPKEALDNLLDEGMRQKQIPGLSMAIFDSEGVVFHTVKGLGDVENGEPIKENTIFEAASLSKPMFAYLIMKYVEKGVLDLDKPLYEYLPYPDIEHDERYKKITARMVLSHTSGFPNWRSDYDKNELFMSFDPGTDYQYSGEGYQYLAKVLAHLLSTDDMGLEKLFQDEIAEPLGMERTNFIPTDKMIANKAEPYRGGEKLKQSEQDGVFGAAFSVHSEAADFSKWLVALVNQEGLSEEGFYELFKGQVKLKDQEDLSVADAWTLGFAKYVVPEGTFYGHGGNNFGYTSGFFLNRESKQGAVIFTNADQVSDFVIDSFLFLIEYE